MARNQHDKISTILLETSGRAVAIKTEYTLERYDILLNTDYTLSIRSEHVLTTTSGQKLIIEISRTPIKGDHLGKSLRVLFGGDVGSTCCRRKKKRGQRAGERGRGGGAANPRATWSLKKNFPPGNFCMAATGREKIARTL